MARRLEMPGRWQSQGQLGVAVPRAIPMPGNAPSIPATIPGVRQDAAAAGAVGRMIAGVGQQVMDQGFQAAKEELAFQEQQLRARRGADLSSLKAGFASRLTDLELDAAKDPDPVGAPARFLERANQLRSDIAGAQQDVIVRNGFNQDSETILADKQRAVKWSAWGREKGMRQAQLHDQMTQWAGALAHAKDPAEGATIRKQWRQTLTDFQAGGWITPEEMLKQDRDFDQTWQTVQARSLLTDNPGRLKEALDRADTFTGIAPEQRAVFRDMAATRVREEQSRRESAFRAARHDELTALRSIVDDQDVVLRAGYAPKWGDLSNARVMAARLGDARLVKRVDEMMEVGNRTAAFGKMTLGEQYRTFSAIAAQSDMTPAEAKSAVALERMIKEQSSALKPAIDEVVKLAREGRDPQALDGLRAIVKGSPHEQALENAVAEGNWKRAFLQATDTEQRQVLDRMNLSGEWSEDKARTADYAKGILAESVRRRETDALGLARDRGLVELQPLPFDSTISFAKALANRAGPARRAQFLLSTPTPQVLTKDESDLLASRLDQAPAEQKVQVLAAMRASLPPDAFRGIADGWMARPETRIYAGAAALAGEGDGPMGPVGEGGPGLVTGRVNDTAVRVLHGAEAARKEPRLLPSKVDLDEKLRQKFGNAFAADRTGTSYALARDMVFAHYAWDGQKALDTSGEFNQERLDRAIKAVTGGFVDWKGQRLLPPQRNMDGNRFDAMMQKLSDADLAAFGRRGGLRGQVDPAAVAPTLGDGTPLTADMLRRHGQLQMLSPGRYAVVLNMLKPGTFTEGTEWRVRPQDGQGDYVLDLSDAVDAIESRQLPRTEAPGSGVLFGDMAERLRRAQNPAPGVSPVRPVPSVDPAQRWRP